MKGIMSCQNCTMGKMAKTTGIIEDHEENCDCEHRHEHIDEKHEHTIAK